MLYDYSAAEPDELSLQRGSVVLVLDTGDGPKDWWCGRRESGESRNGPSPPRREGECDGRTGSFPGTYVAPLGAGPAKTFPAVGPPACAPKPRSVLTAPAAGGGGAGGGGRCAGRG